MRSKRVVMRNRLLGNWYIEVCCNMRGRDKMSPSKVAWLCSSMVHKLFSVPEGTGRIELELSDTPSRHAHRLDVITLDGANFCAFRAVEGMRDACGRIDLAGKAFSDANSFWKRCGKPKCLYLRCWVLDDGGAE